VALNHGDHQVGHGKGQRYRRETLADADHPQGHHRFPRRGHLGEQPGVERTHQCDVPATLDGRPALTTGMWWVPIRLRKVQ